MKCLKINMLSKFFPRQNLSPYLVRAAHSNHASRVKNTTSSPFSILYEKRREKFSTLLSDFGFNAGQVKHILNSPQSILELSEKDLSNNLLNWTTFETNDKIFSILTGNPELLTLNPSFVHNRVKELMTVFTRKDINKLLVTCPLVFLEDFETVTEKVEYIVHKMKVEQNSIVKSHALQFSLSHMMCRHMFMSLAGLYKIQKKSTKSKNPPLHKIFSKNIETYLKLTGLSEEEFVVFCDAYDEGVFHLSSEDLEEFSDDEN